MLSDYCFALTYVIVASRLARAQYSATYTLGNLPSQSENGQSGTNICGSVNSQDSNCQTAFVNSLNDFCLWAPPQPGQDIGNSERVEVAWCLADGYGTRTIPSGAIAGAHWVQTKDYVQITGYGDLTQLNIQSGDAGGELDPHGADGNGNPIGGLIFSNAFGGQMQQIHEWTNFMSANEFCIRICDPSGDNPAGYCQHVYDVMGCAWNMPGNYAAGFDTCQGDSTEPPGVYDGSTWYQGYGNTPGPHNPGPSSQCVSQGGLSPNGAVLISATTSSPSTVSSSSASSTAASSSSSGSSASPSLIINNAQSSDAKTTLLSISSLLAGIIGVFAMTTL